MRRLPLALALLLAAAPLHAQVGGRSTIQGRVVADGGPVPGATVEILSAGENVLRRAQASSTGEYRFFALPAGSYRLRASALGYRTPDPVPVQLGEGETASLTLALTLAPVALDRVEVTAQRRVQIELGTTEFTTELREAEIALLPTSLDPADLVAFTPGARAGQVWGGATRQANNYQIDGLPANHPGVGGDLVQPSIHWIESIEVVGLGAGAEHGNFQGGLINVTTKSGSNTFQGALRTTFETHHLNASNLGEWDVGNETSGRYDVEGEVRGPLVRDRLFYFLAGQWIRRDARWVNHLREEFDSPYLPAVENLAEGKFFGKLTWLPTSRDRIDLSAGAIRTTVDNYGLTGHEVADGALRMTAPTDFRSGTWQHTFGGRALLEAKVAGFSRAEERAPSAGASVPGVQYYGLRPPFETYQNAPVRNRHLPESLAGSVALNVGARALGADHLLKVGGEISTGSFTDERIRNAGMTWRPVNQRSTDPAAPATWGFGAPRFVPTTWGGEVRLYSEVENAAAYVQDAATFGDRVSLSAGVRFGRWRGWLLPGNDASRRFLAVEDAAWEPRLGLTVDLTGRNTLVAKAHWGRYHQNMLAQLFDRVEGGEVFTNEQLWYYYGDGFSDPATAFSVEERDRLAREGKFLLREEVVLNESGPAVDYRQPYVDQWVVGLEKTFAGRVKAEAVYVNRRNRQMVALVDRNAATNYSVFRNVQVRTAAGPVLDYGKGGVALDQLYVRNDEIVDYLRYVEGGSCPASACPLPPGITFADAARLSWNPDYVLTNVSDARREFDQLQLTLDAAFPTWGASGSVVFTSLRGDLDSVTGYDDPAGFGAGPYARPNESVNAFGPLGGYSDREIKLALWGDLPLGARGGVYWNYATGDHYTPRFTLSTLQYGYTIAQPRQTQRLHGMLLDSIVGHNVYVEARGDEKHDPRASVDFRLEREFSTRGGVGLAVSLDLFNLFNFGTVTGTNTSVNRGRNYYYFLDPGQGGSRGTDPSEYYDAVVSRVPPRTLRLATEVRF